MGWDAIIDLCLATVRLATPLVFAALGGLLSERAGVINIALEGKMLVGAFAAGAVAHATGEPWAGLLAAATAGALLAAVYALVAVNLQANQIVAGTGINMMAVGLVPFLAKGLFDVTTSTPALALTERFHSAPPLLAALIASFLPFWLGRTQGGLHLTFAGEHPEALAAAGIPVARVRWGAVIGAGILAGCGGATLSIYLASGYARNMTAGRGFIALAALILGRWRPIPVVLACLLFGLTDALQMRLQGVSWGAFGKVPVQLIQIAPYVVTLVVLAGFRGRAVAPQALGRSETAR